MRERAGDIAEKLGLPRSAGEAIAEALPVSGPLTRFAPTSADITQKVESNLAPIYQPQTTPGKYAELVGEFLPAAAIPGGEMSIDGRLLKMVALPGVASEAAGEATAGTPIEPVARTAAAITAGGSGSGKVPHLQSYQVRRQSRLPRAKPMMLCRTQATDIPVPPQAWNSLNNRAIDMLNTKGLREPIVPKTHAIANDVLGNPQVGDVSDLIIAKRAFKELANGVGCFRGQKGSNFTSANDPHPDHPAAPQLYRQLRTADADYASAMQAKQVENAIELGKLNAGTSG